QAGAGNEDSVGVGVGLATAVCAHEAPDGKSTAAANANANRMRGNLTGLSPLLTATRSHEPQETAGSVAIAARPLPRACQPHWSDLTSCYGTLLMVIVRFFGGLAVKDADGVPRLQHGL